MEAMGEHPDSFKARGTMRSGGREFAVFRLGALTKRGLGDVVRLPFLTRIFLENLLRNEDGRIINAGHVESLARPPGGGIRSEEVPFVPARVLLQDFTGTPVLVDLATMRDAAANSGVDPMRISPVVPADLVIDHSLSVERHGCPEAPSLNSEIEHGRNRERYEFLRWGQQAFSNFRVVPPGQGIIHQINLEHLASVVATKAGEGGVLAFPDTVLGADSHTTMVNALGVLGWGVGGIEAIAAMLGFPVTIPAPQVLGCRLTGGLKPGITALDLALTVTQILRAKGVVGKFVEFFGEGADSLPAADRACLSNMAPEYGAYAGYFPPDAETLRYLAETGREDGKFIEDYLREQLLLREPKAPQPEYPEIVEVDLGRVERCLAGPKRPHDRISLGDLKPSFLKSLSAPAAHNGFGLREDALRAKADVAYAGKRISLTHGSVVIAAITSCTTTSNPAMLIAAGLLAKRALERGLRVSPGIKTSFTPGSRAVGDYLAQSGLLSSLEGLGFHIAGYGCATCIGNSGRLPGPVADKIVAEKLVAAAVLSGNRNFEGRINPLTRANYLASPPLVVAFALAGRVDIDLEREPLGSDSSGRPVFLKEIWPDWTEVDRLAQTSIKPELFAASRKGLFAGDERWQSLPFPGKSQYPWDSRSTYIRPAPYFASGKAKSGDIRGARVLALLGDSVSTDHISPAGAIPEDSPAGRYLVAQGVKPEDFNSYGSRRGNHEVMLRGTFANIRLRNLLLPGREGGFTLDLLSGKEMPVADAASVYAAAKVPLIVIAGREYGCGSSRDWAAKGPALLGVRAVLAAGFERLHRANLAGMGILPLEFPAGQTHETIGLTGRETFDIEGLSAGLKPGLEVKVRFRREDGSEGEFPARARLDTHVDVECYGAGGLLPLLLQRLKGKPA